MRIGILGGTFDPIHLGHLYLARKVLSKFSLNKIIFIPVYLPPHKKNIKITDAKHRCNMLKLAVANYKRFKVSDIEIKRKDLSYSVETLHEFRKQYGVSTELFFITGSDSLKELHKWKNLKEILRLCKFVIVKRPYFSIKGAYRDFITLDIGAKNIQSRTIRERLKKGLSIEGMVPGKVSSYIRKHRLYL